MSIKQFLEESENEFNSKFPELWNGNDGREGYDGEIAYEVRDWHKLQQQKLLEKVVEEIQIKTFPERESDEYDAGYARAIEDLKSKLKAN